MITWWMARQANAEVILRWDDLDTRRVRPESVALLREDLAWLGIKPEREFYQSQRTPIYQDALQRLHTAGFIYPCTCKRDQVQLSAPHSGETPGRYPGHCRDKFPFLDAAGPHAYWRAKMPDQTFSATDLFAGPITQNVQATFGDIALTHADGKIGYQLSSIVDDGDLGIDCVIRGDDLLTSTPQQLALAHMLGIRPPDWCHLPLVVGQTGRRLAKRDGESRVAQFRRHGVKPEKIIGWALWRSQREPDITCQKIATSPNFERPEGDLLETKNRKLPIECSMAEAVAEFDLTQVPREPVVLTAQDLAWLLPS